MRFALLALSMSSQTASQSFYLALCTYFMDVFETTISSQNTKDPDYLASVCTEEGCCLPFYLIAPQKQK